MNNKAISKRIRELRLELGITNYATLAEQAGVSKGLLSAMERGQAGDKVALLSYEKVANALRISLPELLAGSAYEVSVTVTKVERAK